MANTSDFLYPELSPQLCRQLEVIRRCTKEHPIDYLDASPYPEDVKRYLRSWFLTPVDETPEYSEDQRSRELTGDDKFDTLYREVVDIYTGLKNAKPSAGDSSETMAYYRTATSLLEKLVGFQKDCLNIKQIHDFHQAVFEVMDEVLNEDQRNKVLDLLKSAITQN